MEIDKEDVTVVKRNVLTYGIVSTIIGVGSLVAFYFTTKGKIELLQSQINTLKEQQVSKTDLESFKATANEKFSMILKNQETQTRQQDNILLYLLKKQ